MNWNEYLVRDADAGDTSEIFLVASILSILGIRAFLAATGYPQLGGGGLHIAHMMWGGLFMLIALLLVLSFLNLSVRWFAALLAGIGFGTFIDELGRFITEDNDYFYQPTIALLYIIFILLFLLVRSIHWRRLLSPREAQVFLFCHSQLAALGGLAVNLLIYLALRYMIQSEEALAT